MKHALFYIALLGWFGITACTTTPVSQRSALILVPFSQEVSLGEQAFDEILQKENPSRDERLIRIVERVGRRLAAVSEMPNLNWEFKLIESEQLNAFALPGGKTAVYSGLLAVCGNEAGLAAVVGHEIAHVIARHGAQRMSQNLLITGALAAASISLSDNKNRKGIMAALGLGANVGLALPFSRDNESEADYIGMIYMARAGYDPREAERFWKRFQTLKQGGKVPELLSTHPAGATRIADIRRQLPRAAQIYKTNPVQYGLGESFLMIRNQRNLEKPLTPTPK